MQPGQCIPMWSMLARVNGSALPTGVFDDGHRHQYWHDTVVGVGDFGWTRGRGLAAKPSAAGFTAQSLDLARVADAVVAVERVEQFWHRCCAGAGVAGWSLGDADQLATIACNGSAQRGCRHGGLGWQLGTDGCLVGDVCGALRGGLWAGAPTAVGANFAVRRCGKQRHGLGGRLVCRAGYCCTAGASFADRCILTLPPFLSDGAAFDHSRGIGGFL